MLDALRNRSVALLWVGQALSAIGDEIYRVALIWLAVGLIGANTGYLAAAQSASLLILSLIGGKWADHWNPLKTMIRVDALRAAIVLFPVILFYFCPVNLVVLTIVAVSLSALSAFFDPALQASLPRFCPNGRVLQAANGLMGVTARLGRVVGPGIVGFLSAFIPLIHFFTLDALSFMISAISIGALRYQSTEEEKVQKIKIPKMGFYEATMSGFRLVKQTRQMTYVMVAKALTSSMWSLAYGLGFALLVNQIAAHDVKAFGLVIASYGVGNLLGTLVFGNMQRAKPIFFMFSGYVWLGSGFVFVGLAPSLYLVLLASAFSAIGGPINDISFIDLIQARFPMKDLVKMFRMRMAVETGATLFFMSLAPSLLKIITVQTMIILCGAVIMACGIFGLITQKDVLDQT